MCTDFEPVSVQVEDCGDARVVRVSGAICDEGTAEVRAALVTALESGAPRILVDFSGVEYMSSSGIGMMVSMLKRCHQAGIAFAISGLSTDIRELFELTRLDQVFTLVTSLEAWEQALST